MKNTALFAGWYRDCTHRTPGTLHEDPPPTVHHGIHAKHPTHGDGRYGSNRLILPRDFADRTKGTVMSQREREREREREISEFASMIDIIIKA